MTSAATPSASGTGTGTPASPGASAATTGAAKLRILCVDDEPQLLEGLKLQLRRRYDVFTATSGAEGLATLAAQGPFPLVMSDMRMPGMDGATFLARVREAAPDSVRLLLSGQSDLEAAIRVINEGQVFRFLSKPCTPEVLSAALDAARQQYDLIVAERVLLEQTLRGSIQALVDVLAVSHPLAFGRATRIKTLVSELAEQLPVKERWHIEVAAMLSQIGCITLPDEVVEKVFYGRPLDEREQQMVGRLPAVACQLINHIPRLETVRAILLEINSRFGGEFGRGEAIPIGARMVRLAADLDLLELQGLAPEAAIQMIRSRTDSYDPALVTVLAAKRGTAKPEDAVREVSPSGLRQGMVFAEDLRLKNGTLLVARGFEVTAGLLGRIRNFDERSLPPKIRVVSAAAK